MLQCDINAKDNSFWQLYISWLISRELCRHLQRFAVNRLTTHDEPRAANIESHHIARAISSPLLIISNHRFLLHTRAKIRTLVMCDPFVITNRIWISSRANDGRIDSERNVYGALPYPNLVQEFSTISGARRGKNKKPVTSNRRARISLTRLSYHESGVRLARS